MILNIWVFHLGQNDISMQSELENMGIEHGFPKDGHSVDDDFPNNLHGEGFHGIAQLKS